MAEQQNAEQIATAAAETEIERIERKIAELLAAKKAPHTCGEKAYNGACQHEADIDADLNFYRDALAEMRADAETDDRPSDEDDSRWDSDRYILRQYY